MVNFNNSVTDTDALLTKGKLISQGKTMVETNVDPVFITAYGMVVERVDRDRRCGLSRYRCEAGTAIGALNGGLLRPSGLAPPKGGRETLSTQRSELRGVGTLPKKISCHGVHTPALVRIAIPRRGVVSAGSVRARMPGAPIRYIRASRPPLCFRRGRVAGGCTAGRRGNVFCNIGVRRGLLHGNLRAGNTGARADVHERKSGGVVRIY